MPPKENLERACEECIHFFACSRQCGEPMAQSSATGCECYETVKSSMAYYVGTLDATPDDAGSDCVTNWNYFSRHYTCIEAERAMEG